MMKWSTGVIRQVTNTQLCDVNADAIIALSESRFRTFKSLYLNIYDAVLQKLFRIDYLYNSYLINSSSFFLIVQFIERLVIYSMNVEWEMFRSSQSIYWMNEFVIIILTWILS